MKKMQFLENIWYCAAYTAEVADKPLARMICGMPMVLYRAESGEVAALEDRCPHRQAPLSMGNVIGETIQCDYHGFLFDKTGACTHIPRQDRIPAANRVDAFAAVERWGFIWVWWGDQSKVDGTTIPDLSWTADENRRVQYFHWHVNANFQLMADNLLDVSHVDFLHKHSIASKIDPTAKQAEAPKVTMETNVEGDAVHSLRLVHNTMLAGITAAWHGSEGPVTRVSTGKWLPPNSCILKLQFEDENGDINETINLDHIMTPETENTCHYFMDWTWDFGGPDGYPDHDDVDREQRSLIECDDIPMVEAQQRNLELFDNVQDIPVKQDKFVNRVHKVLQRLYAEQGITERVEVTRMAAE
ncbi:MAG: aromatic ring-hydroxylating dioxygenase subunit alpha [Rhodospirillaceae bacterium]|nr:aromatic ring-hydroxylating dioxygenase subunit alpha [Rhodospirillaceae bacterium]